MQQRRRHNEDVGPVRMTKHEAENPDDPDGWLHNHGDMLFRYALSRVRDRHVAEDLVQETLLAAFQARGDYQQRSSIKTWLVGILKHKIIDHFRKSVREWSIPDGDPDGTTIEDLLFRGDGQWQQPLRDWGDPDKLLNQHQFLDILADCIERLPARMKAVFTLREFEGLTTEELCKVLEISTTNNLWVILSRTRLRLRECLEKNWLKD